MKRVLETEQFDGKIYIPGVHHFRPRKATIPADLRWEVWERDNFTCQICGVRRHLAIDHVVPESKGGLMVVSNLQTLCRSCNSKKGNRVTP